MSKNKVRGPDLEKYLEQRGRNHNYLTYAQGARMYSLPYWTFVTLAKDADATWALRKTAIVDTVVLNKYLEEQMKLGPDNKTESEKEKMKTRKRMVDLKETVGNGRKKWVRYDEGAELYSMGLHTFQKYAKDAGAAYRIGNIVLVDTEAFDQFIMAFKVED